jgi:3-phenylpropionate/trans-cinnamate dioxygenase ferredoxin subunit
MAWTTLCEINELHEKHGKYVDIDGRPLAVFLHEGTPHVMDDLCPHAGGEMSGGTVEEVQGEMCAVCPLHGWPFKLADGQMPGGGEGLRVYPSRVEPDGEKQWVQANLDAEAV